VVLLAQESVSAGDLLEGKVFDYTHYSLVMSEPRAMALFVAFNIDGTKWVNVRRGQDRWNLPETSARFDPKTYQVSVEEIEALTPLRFGILKDFDVSKNETP